MVHQPAKTIAEAMIPNMQPRDSICTTLNRCWLLKARDPGLCNPPLASEIHFITGRASHGEVQSISHKKARRRAPKNRHTKTNCSFEPRRSPTSVSNLQVTLCACTTFANFSGAPKLRPWPAPSDAVHVTCGVRQVTARGCFAFLVFARV